MGFLHYAPPLSFYSDSARTALHESNNHDLAALHFWLTLLSPQLLPSQIVPSMLLPAFSALCLCPCTALWQSEEDLQRPWRVTFAVRPWLWQVNAVAAQTRSPHTPCSSALNTILRLICSNMSMQYLCRAACRYYVRWYDITSMTYVVSPRLRAHDSAWSSVCVLSL